MSCFQYPVKANLLTLTYSIYPALGTCFPVGGQPEGRRWGRRAVLDVLPTPPGWSLACLLSFKQHPHKFLVFGYSPYSDPPKSVSSKFRDSTWYTHHTKILILWWYNAFLFSGISVVKAYTKDTTSYHLLYYHPGPSYFHFSPGSLQYFFSLPVFLLWSSNSVYSQQSADLSESLSFLSPNPPYNPFTQ